MNKAQPTIAIVPIDIVLTVELSLVTHTLSQQTYSNNGNQESATADNQYTKVVG
jgi:hypothetical protein